MMKLLVIDDNRHNVELITDIFRSSGFQVISAYDGTNGILIAKQQTPDVILLDINMPGLNGFDVLLQLKNDFSTQNIPVIMVTAQDDMELRLRGLSSGIEDYVTKPFNPKELVARILRTVRSKVVSDDLREKQEVLQNMFGRFVATPIIEQLLKNPDQLKLGGQLQPVTVMFADLEGFTSLSEQVEPELLLQILNQYHSLIVNVILNYGGIIDKFLGDGLMCLYNTPIAQDDHVDRAVKSALHIHDKLYWLHDTLPVEYRLKVNIGIHSGMAVVGNVGTDTIMDFTAVGDTVNVASRLQAEAHGGRIFVTQNVFDSAGDYVFGKARGSIMVRGRKELVSFYEVSNTLIED